MDLPGLGFAKAPVVTCPGIEQDRDEGEIDACPRPLGRIGIGCDQRRAVDAARRKMTPAAVIGDGKVGMAPPGDRRNPVRGRLEPGNIEPEMRGLAPTGRGKDDFAALAHRRSAQQRHLRSRIVIRRAHGP